MPLDHAGENQPSSPSDSAPARTHRHESILVLATSRESGRSSSVLDLIAAEAIARGAYVDRVDARSLPVGRTRE